MEAEWLEAGCLRFESRRLFYPSAGSDILDPVDAFMPHIDEFWFCDAAYTLENALLMQPDFRLNSRECTELSGVTLRRKEPFKIQVSSEGYTHLPTGRTFIAKACRGRGYDCFRVAIKEPGKFLSVFFYRGDSAGEGGSGFYWLRPPTAKYVLSQMDCHAIIVSDGSNAMPRLSIFHGDRVIGRDAVPKCETFTVYNRKLKCIGYLGERYGPTLAWSADIAEPCDEPKRRSSPV